MEMQLTNVENIPRCKQSLYSIESLGTAVDMETEEKDEAGCWSC